VDGVKIIELTGLPGCGKTTLANDIKKNFPELNLLTSDVAYPNRKIFLNSTRFQFLIDLLNLKNVVINILIILYILSYKIDRARVRRIITFITFNSWLIKQRNKESDGYLILDQGFIIMLTSVAHDVNIKQNFIFKRLIKELRKKFSDILFINCELDKQKVIKQIRRRNKKGHRFDSLSDESLQQMLDIRQNNLEIVKGPFQEGLDVLTLNMSSDKEIKIMEILKFIH